MSSFTRQVQQPSMSLQSGWQAILECSAIEVFAMMANVHLQPHPHADEEPHGEFTAMVGMAGALCGITTIRCSRATASRLATAMLGGGAATSNSMARDALGELCNMVAGNFKAKISNLADGCMLSVPTVIIGEDYSMEISEPNDGITVPLTLDDEPLWVRLVSHG